MYRGEMTSPGGGGGKRQAVSHSGGRHVRESKASRFNKTANSHIRGPLTRGPWPPLQSSSHHNALMYHGLVVVHYEALQRPSLGPERRQLVANTPNLQPTVKTQHNTRFWSVVKAGLAMRWDLCPRECNRCNNMLHQSALGGCGGCARRA